jgi:tripartite-type tricarboxylate transporter receptor subunit TctC
MNTKSARLVGRDRQFSVHRRGFLASLTAAFATGTLAAPRLARAASDYPLLQGKTVTILVGSEVGGNFDLFARSIGRHFERVIPKLRVEIKNVPQAGGALAGKTLQEGPNDGTMLLTSSTGLLGSQVQGDEGVAYDLGSWNWLGRLATETRTLIIGPGADFSTLDELRAKTTPSSMSVRSKSSFAYHEAMWLNAMLGLRIKPIPGYKSVEKETALVQGEVMLTVVGYPTDRDMFDQQGIDVVLRLTDGPALPERFAGRPLLADLAAGAPSFAAIAAFMRASTSMQNWMAAPPGTPSEILAEWRHAFESAADSPAYLDEAGKLGFAVSLVKGAELQQQIGDLVANIGSLRAQLDAAHRCGEALSEGNGAGCAVL